MAKLHHMTLRAAVEKYKGLHEEGKSQEEVSAAIAADEKGFDIDQVKDIYAAIIAPPEPLKRVYLVKKEFRDADNFSIIHKEGVDVSHFPKERLDKLIQNGHVAGYDE